RALNREDLPALGRPAITSSAPSRSRSPSGAVARSPATRSRTARHAAVTRAGLTGPSSSSGKSMSYAISASSSSSSTRSAASRPERPRSSCCSARRRSGGNGRRQRRVTAKAPTPDSRITASADRPGGVARATIGSESTLPPSRFPLPLRSLPLLAQPPPGDEVLLRDAEDVAHGVVEVQAGREPQQQERHDDRHEVQHPLRL